MVAELERGARGAGQRVYLTERKLGESKQDHTIKK